VPPDDQAHRAPTQVHRLPRGEGHLRPVLALCSGPPGGHGVKARAGAAVIVANTLFVLALAVGARATVSTVHIQQVDSSKFPSVEVTVSSTGSLSADSIGITENAKPVTVLSRRTLSQS